MILNLSLYIALLTALLIASQNATSQESIQFSNETATALTESQFQTAEDWSLTVDEIKSLETLKRRNQGMLSPDITPLEWLGIFAESDEQRQHYASILAQRQLELMEAITKFELAYSEAIEKEILHNVKAKNTVDGLLLVTTNQCADAKCKSNLVHALRHVEEGGKLDILLHDTEPGFGLKHWIATNKIPLDKLRERTITINIAEGRHQNLPLGLFNLD